MSERRGCASSQQELFTRTISPTIQIDENHHLVRLAEEIDWTELEIAAESVRQEKLKNGAGRPPHLRALLGAMVLRATRYQTYRVLADLIRHYAPARYLCGLTESEWSPNHRTLHDFIKLMGEDGVRMVNELTVLRAVQEKLADPMGMVADTTAQEAEIPYPNEVGLMAAFIASVAGCAKKAGKTFKEFGAAAAAKFKAGKQKAREYRLLAKTKAMKDEVMAEMVTIIGGIQERLGKAVEAAKDAPVRVIKRGKIARARLFELHETMGKLLPQIQHWLNTGCVASGKIISLNIPELYSIVRGKVGKSVEFGLTWGMRRLRGGYLLGTLANSKTDLHDQRYAVAAVDEHVELFGKPPRDYGYDRGGWSETNVTEIKNKGVKAVGLAPRGKAAWNVSGATKKRLVSERAQIEGGIGTIKHRKYGFNRPAARSVPMMGTCGQLALLGFNMNKLVRELARKKQVQLVS
jgi:IS5 family transposase